MLPRIAMMRALHHRLPKPASEWCPRCAVTDLPDGQIKRLPDYSRVQPFREKYFASPFARSRFIDSSRPASIRGALAIVTNVGRDAMDEACAEDERANSDGEVVWS